MRYNKLLALGAVAAFALTLTPAHANNTYSAPGFTEHHLVRGGAYHNKVQKMSADQKTEMRHYFDYENREPCQSYRPIPHGFMRDGCRIVPIPPKTAPRVVERPAPAPVAVNNVLSQYEIHFAFDSASVESDANSTLDRVAREIKHYNPREVTVAGHTDTAGAAEYNLKLSERRAQSVSDALTARGVENRVLDVRAYGQNNLAVSTPDNTALRENRRVVIEFRQ